MTTRCSDAELVSYEIGYGRPPLATRFKKGQSGNPQGRPKTREEVIGELLLAALGNSVTVTSGGRDEVVLTAEALLINQVNRAIKGEPKAVRAVKKLLEKAGMLQRVQDPSHPTGAVFLTPEEDKEYRQHPERISDIVRRARERAANKRPPLATDRFGVV